MTPILLFAMFELAGAWPATTIGPPPVRDINGVAITVGSTVKLVGLVTAINPTSTHFMEVTFQPIYPAANNLSPGLPQQAAFLMPQSPLPGKPVFQAGASQLIVGS